MARIMRLKEKQYHSEILYDVLDMPNDKAIDVYETKEELGGEKSLCIMADNGVVGYIPLIKEGIRASKINIQIDNGEVYKMALQKSTILDEIAYCKMKIDLNNVISGNTEVVPGTKGDNFIQASISNKVAFCRVSATVRFYNKKNEDITGYIFYNETPTTAVFVINGYVSSYGTGNTYEVNERYSQNLVPTGQSYYNKDYTITHSLTADKYSESRAFSVDVGTRNNNSSVTAKITFKSLTINGRQIPVYC